MNENPSSGVAKSPAGFGGGRWWDTCWASGHVNAHTHTPGNKMNRRFIDRRLDFGRRTGGNLKKKQQRWGIGSHRNDSTRTIDNLSRIVERGDEPGRPKKNKKKRKEKEVERRKRNFAVCFPFFGVFDRTGGGAAGPPTGLGRAAESKIKFKKKSNKNKIKHEPNYLKKTEKKKSLLHLQHDAVPSGLPRHWVLPACTRFVPSFTGFDWVVIGFDLVWLGLTGFYWFFYPVLLGFT